MSYAKGDYVRFEPYSGTPHDTYRILRGAVKAASYGAVHARSENHVNIETRYAVRAATAAEIADYKRRRLAWHREECVRHAALAANLAAELGEPVAAFQPEDEFD